MPVLGIGTDLVKTARFAQMLERNPQRLSRLSERILHPLERQSVIAADRAQAVQQLASAWAAKEALYKSLAPAEQKSCRFSEWRKTWDPERGLFMTHNLPRNDAVRLSLSHDGDYTIAMVVRSLKP